MALVVGRCVLAGARDRLGDRTSGSTRAIAFGHDRMGKVDISDDAIVVAFSSSAPDIVDGDTNG